MKIFSFLTTMFLTLILFSSCDQLFPNRNSDDEDDLASIQLYKVGEDRINILMGSSIRINVNEPDRKLTLLSCTFTEESIGVSSLLSTTVISPYICHVGTVNSLDLIYHNAYQDPNLHYRSSVTMEEGGGYLITTSTYSPYTKGNTTWVIKLFVEKMLNGKYTISYIVYSDKRGNTLIKNDNSFVDDGYDYNYGFRDFDDGSFSMVDGKSYSIINLLEDKLNIELSGNYFRVFSNMGKVKSSPEIAYVKDITALDDLPISLYFSKDLSFGSKAKINNNGGYILRMSTWGDGSGIQYVIKMKANVDPETGVVTVEFMSFSKTGA